MRRKSSNRAKMAIRGGDIENRIAQAMAEIGFTFEPGSQIGDTFTFGSHFRLTSGYLQFPSRLVVTRNERGITVVGLAYWVDRLERKLGAGPQDIT
jgi:hypothetical protein